jgi:sugar phosphate isomerase/epimerase
LLISFFCKAQQEVVYIFSYFKDNGEDGLHLAYSYDGYLFKALNNDNSFLKPAISKDKLMRDPCIIRGTDGRFHMVWTVSWNDRGIGYASSPDLIHWSEQQYIPLMVHEDSARNCWAPEITYDAKKKQYMTYWATTIPGRFSKGDISGDSKYNHRMYYTITKDFKIFSKAKLLYDKSFNVIDATIQKNGNRYTMFLKDETRNPPQKNIRIATSKLLTKNYSNASSAITGNYWAEGPTAVKIGEDWIVYFDKYTEHKYGAVTSKDLINWTDISDKITFPAGTRHGTVFTISKEEFSGLINKIIPQLGIIAPLEQDSLIYASGFRMLGESVGRMLSPSLTAEQFQQNLLRIKKAKCQVFLCNIFFPGEIKIAGPNVDENRVLGYADTVFSRAKKAGIPFIILGSGGARRIPDGYDAAKALADFALLCRKLAITAKKYDIMIALESLEATETNFLITLRSAAEMVRAVAHPNFKLNADIFHMMREGESPQSIIDAADVLVYCEIAEKQKRSLPGVQGDDFKPYLRALRKANYKGYIFIEGNTNNLNNDIPLGFKSLTRQLEEVYAE